MLNDLTLLYYFQQVAKFENITRAAEAIHISQPNLSNAITRLENSLGITLFNRRKGRIELNEFGKTFLTYVDRAFGVIEEGKRAISEMATSTNNSLTIAYSIYFNGDDFLERFRNRYTDSFTTARLSHYLVDSESVQAQLLAGNIDVAMQLEPSSPNTLTWHPVTNTYVSVIVSKRNPISTKKDICLHDLKNENFICRLGGLDRHITTRLCSASGFTPKIVFESSSSELVGKWIEESAGVSLLSSFDVVDLLERHTEVLNKSSILRLDYNETILSVGFLHNPDHQLNQNAQNLISFGIEHFKQLGLARNQRWESFCRNLND